MCNTLKNPIKPSHTIANTTCAAVLLSRKPTNDNHVVHWSTIASEKTLIHNLKPMWHKQCALVLQLMFVCNVSSLATWPKREEKMSAKIANARQPHMAACSQCTVVINCQQVSLQNC